MTQIVKNGTSSSLLSEVLAWRHPYAQIAMEVDAILYLLVAEPNWDVEMDMRSKLQHSLRKRFPMSKLRRLREEQGIPQHELGAAIGIKQPHVANMEAGRGVPSAITYAKWVRFLYSQTRQDPVEVQEPHGKIEVLDWRTKEERRLGHIYETAKRLRSHIWVRASMSFLRSLRSSALPSLVSRRSRPRVPRTKSRARILVSFNSKRL